MNTDRVAANLSTVRARIAAACARCGRDAREVTLLCVTKQRPIEQVHELYQLGERRFAENRAQEARERIPSFGHPAEWHFIGPIQTNKAKYLPGLFTWVHSIDRIEAAEALAAAMARRTGLPPMNVLIQVNVAEESQKHGATADDTERLLRAVSTLPLLAVQGLMCMAPYSENPEDSRPVFRELVALRETLQKRTGLLLPQLSMGMTGDFEVAIEEGATMVRVGTALFE